METIETKQTSMQITGMTCAACANRIEECITPNQCPSRNYDHGHDFVVALALEAPA